MKSKLKIGLFAVLVAFVIGGGFKFISPIQKAEASWDCGRHCEMFCQESPNITKCIKFCMVAVCE